MSDHDADVVVIGAGALGLAAACRLAARRRVIVVEKNEHVGLAGSSRNSGVAHAGIHYPPGSLKARTCVRGRALLEERCARSGLPYRRTGKLVVACDESELAALDAIEARAAACDAGPTRRLDGREVRALEPALEVRGALHVAATAVVSPRAIVRSLHAELEALGGHVALGAEVTGIAREASAYAVLAGGRRFRGRALVIAAGLAADELALLAGCALERRHVPCVGSWMRLHARFRDRFSRLVYPLPARGGLGVHLTLDLDGGVRAGPDVAWPDDPPRSDAERRSLFGSAIRRYLPTLEDHQLEPAGFGIRPKLHGPDEAFADFDVRERAPGLVVCLGIESPGLTAALALAEEIERLVAS